MNQHKKSHRVCLGYVFLFAFVIRCDELIQSIIETKRKGKKKMNDFSWHLNDVRQNLWIDSRGFFNYNFEVENIQIARKKDLFLSPSNAIIAVIWNGNA